LLTTKRGHKGHKATKGTIETAISKEKAKWNSFSEHSRREAQQTGEKNYKELNKQQTHYHVKRKLPARWATSKSASIHKVNPIRKTETMKKKH
jgi:hypothetical protein